MSAASLANIATLGWYRRHAERARIEQWKIEWRRIQNAPSRVIVLEPSGRPNPLGGITVAQASANMSALSCPAGHRNAVPVESDGETVAALCPDCDRQLPPEWAPRPAPGLNGALYETLRDRP